ncbi:hypothetical protein L1987_84065 [Smallanthus sonchifolius]|uniref:Uncharacterized protein n=1 Tax=Smallanthus sonchifolius TaxID=185202 RepID=A0ACB8YEC1_9ASTR|nr:hypothetical protein L1987_84065 [Smallanthus sonchifolius]
MVDEGGKYTPNTTPPPPSSSTTPPPPPIASGSRNKRPMTSTKSSICPVCKKDLCHEKALNGHMRWHSLEEREAAGIGIARALASGVVVVRNEDVRVQDSCKRAKVPDLNYLPPPEDEDD